MQKIPAFDGGGNSEHDLGSNTKPIDDQLHSNVGFMFQYPRRRQKGQPQHAVLGYLEHPDNPYPQTPHDDGNGDGYNQVDNQNARKYGKNVNGAIKDR
jgi:hypothetical protein